MWFPTEAAPRQVKAMAMTMAAAVVTVALCRAWHTQQKEHQSRSLSRKNTATTPLSTARAQVGFFHLLEGSTSGWMFF